MTEDETLDNELLEEIKEYEAARAEKGAVPKPLTADMLTPEIKSEIGLDVFPDDIQNDILALAEKITKHFVQLSATSESGEKDLGRMAMCVRTTPFRQIGRDALQNRKRWGPVVSAFPSRYRPVLRLGIPLTTMAAGMGGHMVGCMQMGIGRRMR